VVNHTQTIENKTGNARIT